MIGGRCRAWRVEHGYTQQDIAAAGGCSKSLVSLFEHEKRKAPAVLRGFLSLGYPLEVCDFLEYLEVCDFVKYLEGS